MYLSTEQIDIREQSGCMVIVDQFVKLKSCNKFFLEDVSLFLNVCNYLFILFIYFRISPRRRPIIIPNNLSISLLSCLFHRPWREHFSACPSVVLSLPLRRSMDRTRQHAMLSSRPSFGTSSSGMITGSTSNAHVWWMWCLDVGTESSREMSL